MLGIEVSLIENNNFCSNSKLFVLKNEILWNKILINKTISFYKNIYSYYAHWLYVIITDRFVLINLTGKDNIQYEKN